MESREQLRQQELLRKSRYILFPGIAVAVMMLILPCGVVAQDRAQESLTSTNPAISSHLCRFAVALPEMEGPLTLGIFSPEGNLIRLLYRDAPIDSIPAGLNGLLISWDGKDDSGAQVPIGLYHARGLVHRKLAASLMPYGGDSSLQEIGEWSPVFMSTFLSQNRIIVLSARDALLEKRLPISFVASCQMGKIVIAAERLPILEIPLESFRAAVNPEVRLRQGSRMGTAELTVMSSQGKESYVIAGLDQIVPLDAGALPMPPDQH